MLYAKVRTDKRGEAGTQSVQMLARGGREEEAQTTTEGNEAETDWKSETEHV